MRIHDYLDYWAVQQPDDVYATDGSRSVTWAEMQRWSNQVAHRLSAELAPGDRFAFLCKNSIAVLALYYGAFRVGAVPVPLNFRLAPPEWLFIARDAGARLVVAESEFTAAFEGVREELGVPCLVTMPTEPVPDHWADFDAEVAARPVSAPSTVVDERDDLYQMYTSGTTGLPKGAILTHYAIDQNIRQILIAMGIYRSHPMIAMPLCHAAAAVTAFSHTAAGSTLTIVRDFVPAHIVCQLRERKIETVTLVPAMIRMLLEVPGIENAEFPDLQTIAYGASPTSTDLLRRAIEVFGCDFLQLFGMTEISGLASVLSANDHRRALEGRPDLLLSAGRAVLGTELRIADTAGNDLPVGEIGEILIRGPQLMRGYWNLPDATSSTLEGGWMHTGDAGRLDEDGYLYISDRIKDMVVSGGENIYPREVEEVLLSLDGVADAAVIGVPDDRWGEAVKAVVVLAAGAELDEDTVIAYCQTRLAGFKCPRSVDVVPELPRNATGKVLKRALRAPYWRGKARAVS